jgi:hypothetical protein
LRSHEPGRTGHRDPLWPVEPRAFKPDQVMCRRAMPIAKYLVHLADDAITGDSIAGRAERKRVGQSIFQDAGVRSGGEKSVLVSPGRERSLCLDIGESIGRCLMDERPIHVHRADANRELFPIAWGDIP